MAERIVLDAVDNDDDDEVAVVPMVVERAETRAHDRPSGDERTPFVAWWPETARTVAKSLHHFNSSVRRSAVAELLPMIDRYGPVHVPPVSSSDSPTAMTLCELYETKRRFEEQHMRAVRDEWVTKLRGLSSRMRESSMRCEDAVKQMVEIANRAGNQESVRVLLNAYIGRVRRECEQDIRAWRAEALVSDERKMPDLSSIERKVAEIERDHPALGEGVRNAHNAMIKNVEHGICLELQDECRALWMPGLRT